MDKALLIVIAIAISALLGGGWYWARKLLESLHASYLLQMPARLLRDSERKLNRENRPAKELHFRGTLLTAIVVIISLVVGFLFSLIFKNPFFTLVLLVICLPVGSSWSRINSLKKHLQAGNINAAREQLEGTVFRHHAILDAPSLARAAVEYLVVQFSLKIVAPIFWFMLLGVAGLFASLSLSLLQETLAGAANKPSPFGKTSSDAVWLLNYLPARLAAFLWMVSILFLPNSDWQNIAARISEKFIGEAPNRLALLCAASSLNLSLGGKTSAYCNDRWIGNGKIAITTTDLTRAQFLYAMSCLLLFVCIGFFV